MFMLKKRRKLTTTFFISIIILFILCSIVFLINFFTKENTTVVTIVGINPVDGTRTTMIYQEPLRVILEEEEKIISVEQEEMPTAIMTEEIEDKTIGKIEIPKTEVDLPIFNQVTVEGMEKAPCLLYSTGKLNQNGNHLIVGHNFRNGTIFSNNKNLELGDKIYVTTLDGNKVEYNIYDKFITTAEDVSYIKRDTHNQPEITLSCCTDDDEYRIIILAKI